MKRHKLSVVNTVGYCHRKDMAYVHCLPENVQWLHLGFWDGYRGPNSHYSEQAAAEAVRGSEGFIDRMRRAMNDVKENVNVRRESTQQRRLRSWRSLDEVIRAVESAYGIPEAEGE